MPTSAATSPRSHRDAISQAAGMQRAGTGLDGCRAGWVVATVFTSAHAGPTLSLQILPDASLAELLCLASAANPVLIDMPIGLPTTHPREVDSRLRCALGSRRASVFDVPARATLAAVSHAEACDLQAGEIGRRLSIQSWHLVPRIRHLDTLMRQHAPWADHVHESHPEWLFRLLAHHDEVAPKKSAAGQAQRLALLAQAATAAGLAPVALQAEIDQVASTTRRAHVQPDDLCDATVLALAAFAVSRGGATTLPAVVPRDACGLPMAVIAPRAWLPGSPGL